MRTRKSIINLTVAWITQIIIILLNFILRTVFVRYLNKDYLGLNGLFSNILLFLSFAELGFGAAFTVCLYEPLQKEDYKTVSSIMKFFKQVYTAVGMIVLIVGLSLCPFLSFFIKEIPNDIPNIVLIYALNVINSAISYFFTYKTTLIIADQNKYIVSVNMFLCKTVCIVLQIISLVCFRNYILFLTIQIVVTFISNCIISVIADRRYSFFGEKTEEPLDIALKQKIFKNVSATVLHKVGAVIILGTDNILISKYLGLSLVACYTNYQLIINALTEFLGQVQESVMASVGNFGVTADGEEVESVFERYLFLANWLFGMCAIVLFVLLNPFITVWLGKDYLISNVIVLVICVNFFITGYRSAAAAFNNVLGLFWYTRFIPVVEACLNIAISIYGVLHLGMLGVFLGTFISSATTGLVAEPYVLYKHKINKSGMKYAMNLCKDFVSFAINMCITYYVVNAVSVSEGYIEFAVKSVIAVVLSNCIYLAISLKNQNFYFYLSIVKNTKIGSKIFR